MLKKFKNFKILKNPDKILRILNIILAIFPKIKQARQELKSTKLNDKNYFPILSHKIKVLINRSNIAFHFSSLHLQ